MATDFTIRDVLEWARTKPADERYEFIKPGICALGQFAREVRGFSELEAECEDYGELVSSDLRGAAQGAGECSVPIRVRWTFGALVRRLEALCPAEPMPQSEWSAIDAYMLDIEAVSA